MADQTSQLKMRRKILTFVQNILLMVSQLYRTLILSKPQIEVDQLTKRVKRRNVTLKKLSTPRKIKIIPIEVAQPVPEELRSKRSHYHHRNHHHLSLSSLQPPPPVTIIITTITICHYHHRNHLHLSLSSTSQRPPSVTIIITTTTITTTIVTIIYYHRNHRHLSLL